MRFNSGEPRRSSIEPAWELWSTTLLEYGLRSDYASLDGEMDS